eukprot:TRINITY_DN1040_c0_g1_i2.p1 TRINITY_DN1040_c0_g1~~TRINITY_DN1040_c0_g1_i2.p1  ORF type:complete len:346 (+),score=21.59 TRINITY_DN1040_c0_g1_i2:205-1242(+)
MSNRRRERVQTGRSNRSRPDTATSIDATHTHDGGQMRERPQSSLSRQGAEPPLARPVSALRGKTPNRPGSSGSRPGTGASRPYSAQSRPDTGASRLWTAESSRPGSRLGTAERNDLYQERPFTSNSNVGSEVLFLNEDGPDTVVRTAGPRAVTSMAGVQHLDVTRTGGSSRRPKTTGGQVKVDDKNHVWVVDATKASKGFVKSGQESGWKPVPSKRQPTASITAEPQLRFGSTIFKNTASYMVPEPGTGLYAGPQDRFTTNSVSNKTMAQEEKEHKLKARAAREERVRAHAARTNEQAAVAQINAERKEHNKIKRITKQKIEHLEQIAALNKPARGGGVARHGAR